MAFSPDGRRLVSASMDKTLRVWDTEGAAELFKIACSTVAVHACFSGDGRQLAALTGDAMLFFDSRESTPDEKMGRFFARQWTDERVFRDEVLELIRNKRDWNEAMRAAANSYAQTAAFKPAQAREHALDLLAAATSSSDEQVAVARHLTQAPRRSAPENLEYRRLESVALLRAGDAQGAGSDARCGSYCKPVRGEELRAGQLSSRKSRGSQRHGRTSQDRRVARRTS